MKAFYKIRHKETKLYSLGGTRLSFHSKVGKTWVGEGPLKNHINLVEGIARNDYYRSGRVARDYLNNMEVVTLEITETASISYDDFVKNSRRLNEVTICTTTTP